MQHKFAIAVYAGATGLGPIDSQYKAPDARVDPPQLVDRPAFERHDKDRGLARFESRHRSQPLRSRVR